MLGHNVRGQWWWYSSWGWTFQLIFHDILLLCDRWLQRGCLIKWCLTQKCIWSKGMELNSSMWKKNGIHWHSSTLAEHSWRPNSRCQNSKTMDDVFQEWWQQRERQAMLWMAMQIFMSMACRLLFITGENALLVVVAVLKNNALYPRICTME